MTDGHTVMHSAISLQLLLCSLINIFGDSFSKSKEAEKLILTLNAITASVVVQGLMEIGAYGGRGLQGVGAYRENTD